MELPGSLSGLRCGLVGAVGMDVVPGGWMRLWMALAVIQGCVKVSWVWAHTEAGDRDQ